MAGGLQFDGRAHLRDGKTRRLYFVSLPNTMETLPYLRFLAVWWWLILASLLIAAGISYHTNSQSPRIHQSRTTLLVGKSLRSSSADFHHYYRANAGSIKKSARDRRQQRADAAPAAH